jgi:hypothetical protein
VNTPIAAGARAAATRLDRDFGPGLPSDVEATLLYGESGGERSAYFDPVSVGSLIVAVATLTWTIYRDQRDKGQRIDQANVLRAVQIELQQETTADAGTQDKIVTVVVTEVIKAAEKHQ